MYENGIYQSDIKPPNIAFSRHAILDEYEPKLIDFGCAATDYNDINGLSGFYFFN